MEPEFNSRCVIVVDPTGHATDGSYVLAKRSGKNNQQQAVATGTDSDEIEAALEPFVFRQLRCDASGVWRLCPLNDAYPSEQTESDFSEIVGVIVQRAGTRRRYHKHYD